MTEQNIAGSQIVTACRVIFTSKNYSCSAVVHTDSQTAFHIDSQNIINFQSANTASVVIAAVKCAQYDGIKFSCCLAEQHSYCAMRQTEIIYCSAHQGQSNEHAVCLATHSLIRIVQPVNFLKVADIITILIKAIKHTLWLLLKKHAPTVQISIPEFAAPVHIAEFVIVRTAECPSCGLSLVLEYEVQPKPCFRKLSGVLKPVNMRNPCTQHIFNVQLLETLGSPVLAVFDSAAANSHCVYILTASSSYSILYEAEFAWTISGECIDDAAQRVLKSLAASVCKYFKNIKN